MSWTSIAHLSVRVFKKWLDHACQGLLRIYVRSNLKGELLRFFINRSSGGHGLTGLYREDMTNTLAF